MKRQGRGRTGKRSENGRGERWRRGKEGDGREREEIGKKREEMKQE